MRATIAAIVSLVTIGMAQAAYAQSGDSVVMRRALDPKTRTFAWVPSEWSQCSNSCGAGQQTRAVQCMMNGKHGAPEVNCGSERPADTQSCYDVQGCSYTWKPGSWTDVQGCGKVVETRELTCLRGDGQTVSNDQCPTPAPDTVREVRDLRTCSYAWKTDEWSAFSGECQTAAVSTRAVWCERSNGEKVGDGECSVSGKKPEASKTEDRYGQCGYSWKEKPWTDWSSSCQTGATRTREVVCLRTNGDEVADSFCAAAGAKPSTSETGDQYGKCTYSWKEQSWGAVVPACGASSRSRSVQCIRSNGDVVADGSCDASSKPAVTEAATDYQTCTYGWNEGAWSAPSNTCGSAVSTRSVTCLSSDGRTVGDASCLGTKPDISKTTYETSGCSYSWNPGGYGAPVPACGATVQNRPVTCLRSDGQTVGDASCDPAKRPATQQAATDYSTCTYGWVTDGWGAWSSSCGAATQSRTVRCQSSDGRTVADTFCVAATKPGLTQSAYQTSGCTFSWQWNAWSSPVPACGASKQTRTVWCLRSDGQVVTGDQCDQAVKPAGEQPATDYGTCSYSWQYGNWSSPSTMCGSATQTRDVWCQRSDGTRMSASNETSCGSGRPAASQSSYQIGSCTYSRVNPTAWSGWDNACSGSAKRTRTYQCQRQDGEIVDGAECTSRSISLSDTETGANYTNACPGYFTTGGWSDYNSHCSTAATRTRAVNCYRSGDNVFAGDQYCIDRGLAVPPRSETTGVYDQCGYEWKYNPWGAPVAACGASTQYRDVWCQRTDGARVSDTYCGAGRPVGAQSATDYSTCTYGWNYSGWTTTAQSCGSVSQSRTVWCRRADGATVADGYCGAGKPAATQSYADYSSCTYAGGDYLGSTDWNSYCSASASRTNNYNCKRSDGVVVSNAECTSRNIAVSAVQYAAIYDRCGYEVNGWSGASYGSTCSSNTTSTIYATACRRSDGTQVAVSECSSRGVATSQTSQTSNYTGCTYSWQADGWSAQQPVCTSGTQTQNVWCRRSDGASVDGGLCGGGRPADTQTYSNNGSCTYSATGWTGYGACDGSFKYSTAKCLQSNGIIVADAECTNRNVSLSQKQACTNGFPSGYQLSTRAMYAPCYSSGPYYMGCTRIGSAYYTSVPCSTSTNVANSQCGSGYQKTQVAGAAPASQCQTVCQ